MHRREFIILTGSATAFLPFFTFNSCRNSKKQDGETINQFTDAFELEEFSIDDLQKKMDNGDLSSEKICNLYLERIGKIDKNGIKLNSVIEINPDALKIAKELDTERKSGKLRSKMHGIPVLIKDNIDTGDNMLTTAGSIALMDNVASKDAYIINRLREAGAVILGKTNLSEFANFRSTRSVSGWSSRGGQTRNPYVINRNPCGSSSGSGTAVSANLCAIAIGTETDGSIICPSSINGIVGIKPTVGLWSRTGIIPISFSQDTAGPMARNVADASILLGLLAGKDENDSKTSEIPDTIPTDYTTFLDKSGLKGKTLGVPKSMCNSPFELANKLFLNNIEQLKKLGATIIEFENNIPAEIYSAEYQVLLYEFKDGLNQYLSKSNSKIKSLKKVIDFNVKHENEAMPYFKQEILEQAETKGNLDTKEYAEAHKNSQLAARKYIDELFNKYKLDAICGFGYGPAWCTDYVNGDHFVDVGMNIPAAIAGYPSISVPMGFIEELPIGLTFVGKPFDESGLISLAYAYEQSSHNRRPPKFIESIESK